MNRLTRWSEEGTTVPRMPIWVRAPWFHRQTCYREFGTISKDASRRLVAVNTPEAPLHGYPATAKIVKYGGPRKNASFTRLPALQWSGVRASPAVSECRLRFLMNYRRTSPHQYAGQIEIRRLQGRSGLPAIARHGLRRSNGRSTGPSPCHEILW
jgi:hypothetical protein